MFINDYPYIAQRRWAIKVYKTYYA